MMFADINTAAIVAFGQPFTYVGLNADVELSGIFGEQLEQANFGGVPATDRTFTLQLLKTAADAAGIERMQAVIVDEVKYQILDKQSDTTGLTTLKLRRFK